MKNSRSAGEQESNQYPGIDLVRFICALLVMTIHLLPGSRIPWLNFAFESFLARVAVPFFFVTSGFFLYGKSEMDPFHFEPSKKYIVRMGRLYLLWSLIYLPLSVRELMENETGVTHFVLAWLRNFLFSGSFLHLWYLNALIFAVLFVSILLSKKVSPEKICLIGFLLYIPGLLGQSWFGLLRPLWETSPALRKTVQTAMKLLVTTRDGLFFGVPFVSMGMYIAYCDIRLSVRITLPGFVLSMICLCAEILLLRQSDFILDYNMFLCLIPAAFFLFCLARGLSLPPKGGYRTLRVMSSLIYYAHIWINTLAEFILIQSGHTTGPKVAWTRFLLALIGSIAFSYGIYRFSLRKGFKWLSRLYT